MQITATNIYVPNTIVSNAQLAEKCDAKISQEWVETNLGIKQRRVADEDCFSSDLAAFAINNLFEKDNIDPKTIDMLIVATATPDLLMPSCACAVQLKTGLVNAFAFDIAAVCSGFLYALTTANNYIKSGMVKRVLVVGVDTFSKITDWNSRDCIFFGDGAGAALVEAGKNLDQDNFTSVLHSDTSGFDAFKCEHGGKFAINAPLVKASASKTVPYCINKLMDQLSITPNDIDVVVPHQPSIRLLKEVSEHTNISFDKFCLNMDKYGNTAGGTVPIILHESIQNGQVQTGTRILFITAGAGFTAGAAFYVHH